MAVTRLFYCAGAYLLMFCACGAGADSIKLSPAPASKIDFTREARPILASHCFKCHGQDEGARKARLRLDVRENAIKPAKSDEIAIVPGQPDKSELVRRILADNDDDLMPPPGAKNPLTQAEKETLKQWIAEGAEYQPHWAFIAPKQSPPPKVNEKTWPQNAIDYFVLARLEKEGLKPSPRADKYTLVRRLYLDITGLPPTTAQADAFAGDVSPTAYERLVDQLLASPHYGERWARRWLDLARYADTNGYEKDRQRSIWPWRDWVINSLNADMSFDEFTIEQIAGDLLPNATPDQVIATGFNRNSMLNEEGGIDPLEYRFYSMVDRVHVTATTWLGLTMACAQCHTHKYDPIQHAEYYRFMACLDNAIEPELKIVEPAVAKQRRETEEKINALEAALPDKFTLEMRPSWRIPGLAEFSSMNGSEAEFLTDGSFRVGGTNPEKDTYTINFETAPQRITHVQIEAIPDDKFGKGGPGRGDNGNFVLSELEMEIQATNSGAGPRQVKFASAQADYAQEGYPEKNAIDGNTDTGWAINGPGGTSKHHHAIFALAEPVELKSPATITIRLVQNLGLHHTLGRFRISFGEELADKTFTEQRRRETRDRRCEQWLEDQLPAAANWQALHPVAATSTAPILQIQADDSIFCFGDFTKSDTYTVKFRDLPAGLKAIRLEMLTDDRLPNRGPGSVYYEGQAGDFWLSTVKVKADGQALVLTNATESYADKDNNAAKTLDDDAQTGWSIKDGGGKAQNAVFQFAQPLTSTNELQLDLVCEKYYAAGLGRFRIWVTTNDNAGACKLDNEASAILTKYRDKDRLKSLFASTNDSLDRDVLLRQFALLSPDFAGPRGEIEKLRATMPKFSTTLVMQERPPGQERKTFVHHRGEFLQLKDLVTPGMPAFLPALPDNAPKNRLALAKWLVSAANPLTGRVIMNRQWEALFGRGIVRTSENFGFQGDLPSHQELLDWLAVEFAKQGWSQKKMLKLIVMSTTYQQSSTVTPELGERDPLNVLLARGPRFRLDAEMVRDSALVAGGLLSEKIGGPSVYPPQPPGVSSEGAYGPLDWKTSEGPDRYRRGLYTFAKRTTPYAMTATFDGPSGEVCLARRDRSNSPLQALTSLNDAAFMECARALGKLTAKADGDDASRVDMMFRRCLTRPPSNEERASLVQFYQTQLARFVSGELKAAEIMEAGEDAHLNEQAAWTIVARVLLNLDETINKS
ncbi:MAG: Planctomycete cytochrome [Pedosphaera sp.]|nr:Planctomycete cytochrome [Pedosphaera sp.]